MSSSISRCLEGMPPLSLLTPLISALERVLCHLRDSWLSSGLRSLFQTKTMYGPIA
jgi:hypothetical protein